MKHLISLMAGVCALAPAGPAFAQAPPPPDPPPINDAIDEVNVMLLIDVSGSMAEDHTTGQTKLETAIILAKEFVEEIESDSEYTGLSKEYALWAFDGSFGAGNGYVERILDFPATATQVYQALGYNGGTLDAALTPSTTTPLAGAGCYAAGELVASLDENGALVEAGYEWQKNEAPSNPAEIARRLYIGTDGLENATPSGPSGNECGGITSDEDYANYEEESWQYKLRNKYLTGSPELATTLNSLQTLDVHLIFENYISGLSGGSSEQGYSGGTPYTTEPTLNQALEFYGGLADNTLNGSFQTVTVDASGAIISRRPGDIDFSGCVGNADYAELSQWYGQAVDPQHPHSYWADLNGDGWVDYLDYLILYNHWGDGGVC